MLMARAEREKNVFNNTAIGAKVSYAAHWGRGGWSAIAKVFGLLKVGLKLPSIVLAYTVLVKGLYLAFIIG